MSLDIVTSFGFSEWGNLFKKAGVVGEIIFLLGAVAAFIIIYKVIEFIFIGILPFHRAKQKPLVFFDGYQGKAAIEARGAEYVSYLEKGFIFLQIIATVSPLLGLLGTVIGMIEAFQTMATLGDVVNVSNLASGIWKALLTTAMGLGVAIPTMVITMILQNTVEKHITYINKLLFTDVY